MNMKVKLLCDDCGKEYWGDISPDDMLIFPPHHHMKISKDACK